MSQEEAGPSIMPWSIHKVKASRKDQRILQSLGSDDRVVMFTPAIWQQPRLGESLEPDASQVLEPDASQVLEEPEDFFESLQEALAERLRPLLVHASFHFRHGFTTFHEELVWTAKAVIVVLAVSHGYDDDLVETLLSATENFAFSTRGLVHDDEVFPEGNGPPVFIIGCGDIERDYPEIKYFRNVIFCPYFRPEVAGRIRDKLLGGR